MLSRLITCALFITCMLFAGASPARADALYPVTITFDDMTAGRAIMTQPTIWSIRGSARFDSSFTQRGEFRVATHPQATTSPNAAFGVGPLVGDPSFDSLQIHFNSTCPSCPLSIPCPRCTDFVSLNVVGTQPGQTAAWDLVFYNFNGTAIHRVTGTTDQFVIFSSTMQDIAVVRFFASPNSANREGVDTITYNAPVPEPATLALFGTGLAVLGAARKRRKASGKQ